MQTDPTALRLFEIQNGLVISETGQQDADDFAADFQGLRHFAEKIGQTLEIGNCQYASTHEAGLTFMYLLPPNAGGQPSRATGAMIGASVSNSEMLTMLRQRNQ